MNAPIERPARIRNPWPAADTLDALKVVQKTAQTLPSAHRIGHDDLTQEAMLELVKRPRDEIADLPAYAATITRNVAARMFGASKKTEVPETVAGKKATAYSRHPQRPRHGEAFDDDWASRDELGGDNWAHTPAKTAERDLRLLTAPVIADLLSIKLELEQARATAALVTSSTEGRRQAGELLRALNAACRFCEDCPTDPQLAEIVAVTVRPLLEQHGEALDRIAHGRASSTNPYRILVGCFGLSDDFIGTGRRASAKELALVGLATGWLGNDPGSNAREKIRAESQNVSKHLKEMLRGIACVGGSFDEDANTQTSMEEDEHGSRLAPRERGAFFSTAK